METHSSDPEPPLDALAMLYVDHQRVRDLLRQYEAATDPSVKRELVEEVCRQIEMYVHLERNVFAPAVNESDRTPQTRNKQAAIEKILERAKHEMLRLLQEHPLESPRWKPTNRQRYFIILGGGDIKSFQWHGTSFDEDAWNFGNCFRSRKDAEQARNTVKEFFVNFHNRHAKREKLWEYHLRDATRFVVFMVCCRHGKETLQRMCASA